MSSPGIESSEFQLLVQQPPTPPIGMGIREYARHRGVTQGAVQRAIKSGRLSASLVLDDRGWTRILPELADDEWAASTESDRAPLTHAAKTATGAPAAPSDYIKAKTRLAELQVARLELEYAKEAGKLMDAADVERGWTEILTMTRNRLLGFPDKLRQVGASREVCVAANEYLLQALEDLADSASLDGKRRLQDDIRDDLTRLEAARASVLEGVRTRFTDLKKADQEQLEQLTMEPFDTGIKALKLSLERLSR